MLGWHRGIRTDLVLSLFIFMVIINHLVEGGPGSGFFGHRDIQGQRGGSAPGDPQPSQNIMAPLRGVYLDIHRYTSTAQIDQAMAQIKSLGFDSVRMEFTWSLMSSRQSMYDYAVAAARRNGLSVLGIVAYNQDGTHNAPDPTAYGQYAGFLAAHYNGQVGAWEIWNEPNIPLFGSISPAVYVEMLQSAYQSIKAADPNAVVVMAATSGNDMAWFSQAMSLGAQNYADAVATHPYGGPDSASQYTTLPIWVTETGQSTAEVSQQQQSDFIHSQIDNPSQPTYIYEFASHDYPGKEGGFGLVNWDGTPKQIYNSLLGNKNL